jgi:solute carrier family 35 protein F5
MTRRWLLGLVLLLGVIVIWVLSSTFMQYIFLDQNFAHPFFLTYISTSLFTIYLVGFVFCKSWRSGPKTSEWIIEEEPQRPEHATPSVMATVAILSEPVTTSGASFVSVPSRSVPQSSSSIPLLTVRRIFLISAMFCPLWFAANYTFNASLVLTSVSSNTIISATSSLWTLLFGAILCVEEFAWGKLVGSFLCVAGVSVVSVTDENRSGVSTLKGDLLAIVAAVFYGVYITFLRKQIKNEKQVPMPMFFGTRFSARRLDVPTSRHFP